MLRLAADRGCGQRTRGRPDAPDGTGWSAETEEVLATLRAVAWIQDRFGVDAGRRYVVSFTRSADDIAAVYATERKPTHFPIALYRHTLFVALWPANPVAIRLRPRWIGRVGRIAAPLILAALLAAGAGAYRLEHSYFLGVTRGQVAVMRGVPARVLGLPLFSVLRVTPVSVARIAPAYRGRLQDGIPTESPEDAETLLQDLLHRP